MALRMVCMVDAQVSIMLCCRFEPIDGGRDVVKKGMGSYISTG